jgi:hypothetical protein
VNLELQHHLLKVFDLTLELALLRAEVNDAVAPCEMHTWGDGVEIAISAAVFRY